MPNNPGTLCDMLGRAFDPAEDAARTRRHGHQFASTDEGTPEEHRDLHTLQR